MNNLILEGDNLSTCAICLQYVEDQFQSCVICGSMFHQNHLRLWLSIKNTCPVSRYSIKREKQSISLPYHFQDSIYRDSNSHRILQVSDEQSIFQWWIVEKVFAISLKFISTYTIRIFWNKFIRTCKIRYSWFDGKLDKINFKGENCSHHTSEFSSSFY